MRFSSISTLGLVALSTSAVASGNDAKETYDYIVVGGGPSGIITAERLSETNKKVLLLERGQRGPTINTGSNHSLPWDNSLTPIDVPGLSAAVGGLDLWNEYMCTDTAGLAACVLGGGVTVNYMVFVHPPERDFNDKWPVGWKWDDVAPAAERLYARNPGTTLPSKDNKRYDTGLYNTLSSFLNKAGWKSVDMLKQPNEKHQVYSWPTWNVQNSLRAGPVRTYLPLAEKRDNFSLRMGSKVIRVVRSGSRATGVEVETADGKKQIINLSKNGRVVLSAGAMSTPRILFNSGIGPKKQILNAKKSGVTLPAQRNWIDLPVGKEIKDHPIFAFNIKTDGKWGMLNTDSVLNGTDTKNIKLFEDSGSGVLTQGRHRLIFFTSRKGTDGKTRYFQGSTSAAGDGVISIKVYLTHGLTSSGVLGLDQDGKTVFEKTPYLTTKADTEASKAFLEEFISSITDKSTGYTLEGDTTIDALLEKPDQGDHFIGTAKIGSVVDTNTKVFGIDNLFITDASIHPDLATGNIQTIVMVTAEAAVAKILAC